MGLRSDGHVTDVTVPDAGLLHKPADGSEAETDHVLVVVAKPHLGLAQADGVLPGRGSVVGLQFGLLDKVGGEVDLHIDYPNVLIGRGSGLSIRDGRHVEIE